jgi:hypothetical protein
MNLDDLKHGLTMLADEMEPFEGNVRTLYRRERRRRVAVSSVAALVVVAIAVATVAFTHGDGSGKVHVAGVPSKEVPPDQITHIDAIVVPATPAVKAVLDASPLVGQYARIPVRDRSSEPNLLVTDAVRVALCALQTNDGYAVDAATPGSDIGTVMGRALFGTGRVTIFPTHQLSIDAEVFLKVPATAAQADVVRTALHADPEILSVRYVSKADAYAIFKKDFADQAALVESTRPSDLPESFRIFVKPGRSVAKIVQRYKHFAGVDIVITPDTGRLFDPTQGPAVSDKAVSPCQHP